jgi:hypothetical protein
MYKFENSGMERADTSSISNNEFDGDTSSVASMS